MFFSDWTNNLKRQLFSYRNITRNFQSEKLSYGEESFLEKQPSLPSLPEANLPGIYEEQSGPSYSPMPDFYASHNDLINQDAFNSTPNIFPEVPENNGMETIPNPLESSDDFEIQEAINEVSEIGGDLVGNELYVSPEMATNENPEMPSEAEITQDGMMEQQPEPTPGMEQPQEMFLQAPEYNNQMGMDLEQRIDDPFMNPLYNPWFNQMNPFGPQGPMGPGI